MTADGWTYVKSDNLEEALEIDDTVMQEILRDKTCNWFSYGIVEKARAENTSKPKLEREENMRKAQRKVYACRFGRFVAQWCPLTPAGDDCFTNGRYCHNCEYLKFMRRVYYT